MCFVTSTYSNPKEAFAIHGMEQYKIMKPYKKLNRGS